MPDEETINKLKKRFNPEAAQNVTATYLFNLRGEGGGTWLTKIANGTCEFSPAPDGGASGADCTISVDASDMAAILDGTLPVMTAAMSGVLSFDGEIGLAMQLVPMFFESQNSF